jgi:hypothetical protein
MILSKFWKETIHNVCNPFIFHKKVPYILQNLFNSWKKAFIYHYE